MFGRNQEFLDYNVYPSDEGREILAEEALGRIETVEGIDYLDGYNLPPDNDEVWNPRTIRATIYHTYEHPVTGEIYVRKEEDVIQSGLKNNWIRQRNIHAIAQGMKPLFRTWDEVDLSNLRSPRETLVSRAKGVFRQLVSKAAA